MSANAVRLVSILSYLGYPPISNALETTFEGEGGVTVSFQIDIDLHSPDHFVYCESLKKGFIYSFIYVRLLYG